MTDGEASLEATIATGMEVAPMQIAKAMVAPMQVGAIASVLMQIAHSRANGGCWMVDESCTVRRSPPIISILVTLSRLKSAGELVQSGLSAFTILGSIGKAFRALPSGF